MIGAKHVAPAKRSWRRLPEVLTRCLGGIREHIPGLGHSQGWVIRPGRTPQAIALRQILGGACTKGGPTAVHFSGILRYLERSIKEFLTAFDVVEKECIHKIAHGDPKLGFP